MGTETASFEELLEHAAWLRRFATGLLRDSDAGDDVVQETLIAASRRPPESDRDVRPWLATVARNQAIDLKRGESRRRAREEIGDELTRGGALTPDRLVGDAEIHRLVAETVAALDEPFRSTVLLRYYEGLSASDVARRLGVPAGTVRWRVKEGLERSGGADVPADAGLAACKTGILRAHEDLVEMEGDLFEWDADFAFELGERNPLAEAQIGPYATMSMAQVNTAVLDQRFVCHTWVCRLALLRAHEEGHTSYGPGDHPPELFERVKTVSASAPEESLGLHQRPGTLVHQTDFVLKQPSGEPLSAEPPAPSARALPTIPSTVPDCAALAERLEAERSALRERWTKKEPQEHEFERAPENLALEQEVDARVPWWKSLFGSTACRGRVCRRSPSLGSNLLPGFLWDVELVGDPKLRTRYQLSSHTGSGSPSFPRVEPMPSSPRQQNGR